MFKHVRKLGIFLAVTSLFGILLSAGSAQAKPVRPTVVLTENAHELLTVTGVDGRKAFAWIDYDRQLPGGSDPQLIVWNSAEYWTDLAFLGNRMDIRLETSPGVWQIVWHRGGDKDTWDDVPSSTTVGYLGNKYVNNSSSTPQWQFRVWGACPGYCGDNYREDFGNVW